MLTVTAGEKKGDYMYLAFTEEQAIEIRKLGVSVIEYKYCLNQCLDVSMYLVNKAIKRVQKAICIFAETAQKVCGALSEIITDNYYDYTEPKPPVYSFPKLVCKLDIDYMKNKTMPKIKTKLPRSNC